MPLSRSARRGAAACLSVVEHAIGRPKLARLTRWMWMEVRLDLINDPSTNGEYNLLRSACRDVSSNGSGIFIDVGANLGDWSDTLLTTWLSDGHAAGLDLHAFEPSPASFVRLQDRVAEILARTTRPDIFTRLNDEALGQVADRVILSIVSPTGGTNTLVPFDDAVGESVSVQVTTLDDYAEREALQGIDFVKIDTEGNDLAVIRGASRLLDAQRIRWIQFEYNYRWVSSRTYLRDAFALAERHGYHLGKITPRGVEAYRRWHPELESFREGNYLLWHDTVPKGVDLLPWWADE